MFDSPAIYILLIAFILDCILGDPTYPLHPVRIIGTITNALRKFLFEFKLNGRFGGFLLLIIMLLFPVSLYLILRFFLEKIYPLATLVLDVFIVYSCIALRDMVSHARPVAKSLANNDIEDAREKVDMIVGRDPEKLDKHGIARAAVESVAEGFVDGFLSPVFWFTMTSVVTSHFSHFNPIIAGTIAILLYRTTNTLDSMIGHKNEMFHRFGTFAARLDDILNFIPARLSPLVLVPSAFILRLDLKTALKTFARDRKKHKSPNSAHTESFAAGALGVKLGGPTEYPYGVVEKPWLGDGTPEVKSYHIYSVCRLTTLAGWITIIVCFIASL
ncbi:cobalamin biosynthesis protein CobD [bacterium B17]|nr:cobalamin biosynthesis protein CobD [bacterium B17]